MQRSQKMLSRKWLLIQVSPNNLWNIVDVVSWRVRITFKCVQLFMFWHLSNQPLKWVFLLLGLSSFLLLKFLFLLLLQHLLLILSFLLNVSFHIHYFIFDWVELLVQFFVFIALCMYWSFFVNFIISSYLSAINVCEYLWGTCRFGQWTISTILILYLVLRLCFFYLLLCYGFFLGILNLIIFAKENLVLVLSLIVF
jgi:hypothetical protein